MDIKVLVAAHKQYQMPQDEMYLPMFVGKELHPDSPIEYQGDNSGDNISVKNPHYNELTAIYWAWKNLNADAYGLVHYRRLFTTKPGRDFNNVLTHEQAEQLLAKYDVVVPAKRRYWIESNESHYRHAHHNRPFDVMTEIIERDYPEYVPAMKRVYQRTWAHMYNMFIMKQRPFDEYCTWMFDILSKVEQAVATEVQTYSTYEQRVYGFLSELLLDIWLETNAEYQVVEQRYAFMESQNWFVKGGKFLQRKLVGHP
ncbi:DUF4422 domain-containing protein [Limosilactobacillus equigenerosi]|uniref:Capsular biosynthesis protein n=1 Tax=Limosilactobacillus equigenerosi DSM 18793 = JCM 14505 TaxID=1423742 RepID=A0A0R1UWB4_9LACO|nr:DUF4422 domain-containing protein [Limosilactobacillus equigenerosi]KRL95250.1 capsular biosynthesis protein [Limosilactobacillus equigenerosi DSM 18793 = JCM 14505]